MLAVAAEEIVGSSAKKDLVTIDLHLVVEDRLSADEPKLVGCCCRCGHETFPSSSKMQYPVSMLSPDNIQLPVAICRIIATRTYVS
jgi:hypothetical protein